MLLKLAWRNIWRNKRRTFITLGMIQFAVVLATFMATFRDGIIMGQVDAVVGGFQGFGSIQLKDHFKEPNIDNLFKFSDSLKASLDSNIQISGYSPRVLGGGFVQTSLKSKVGRIVGVDPVLEDSVFHTSQSLVKGRWLEKEGEIVLGEKFASRLKADIDTVLFVQGSGYHGNSANLLLKVVGMVKLGNVEENKRMGFVALSEAKMGFGTEGNISEIALSFHNNGNAMNTVNDLEPKFNKELGIYSWAEINESLHQLVIVNDAGNVIISAILYFIISFGLIGTIIMMLAERKREFGVLVALGMKKTKLSALVYLENSIMALIGTSVGFLIAIPVIYYINQNPIVLTGDAVAQLEEQGFQAVLKTSMNYNIFLYQAITVLGMSLLFSLFSVAKIRSLNEVKAMRG